jgi:FlaG/FlaF family flagellin (archaellin)
MTFKRDKRGVSDVITTVLIILLVLAAVAIIGGLLLRNIGEAGSKIGTQQACLDIDVKAVNCSASTKSGDAVTQRAVFVNRGGRGSDADISKLTLLFEAPDGTVTPKSTPTDVSGSIPKALETTKLTSLASEAINAKYVRTSVIVRGLDGKEVTCEPSLVKVTCTN